MSTRKVIPLGAAVIGLLLMPAIWAQQAAPAQPAAQPPAPGRGVGMGQPAGPPSPEILPDKRVTLRLSAPKAGEVVLSGDWSGGGRVAMTKDDQGVWSVTVGPLTPELWGYTFGVDGVRTLDPRNSNTKRDGARVDNILLISGPESELYELKSVPHGSVSMVWYESPTLKLTRRMYVYTPPGYEQGKGKYPVFYLLHGGGGDEDAWTTLGRTNMILDNLIAQGKAKPMLVVMTNGNANQVVSQGYALGVPPAGRGAAPARGAAPERGATPATPGQAPAGRGGTPGAQTAFPDSLVKDVIPFIEKNYRVLAAKDSRAIAGLSMGGGHTVSATNNNPGKFGYIGVWSAGTRNPDETLDKQLAALKASGVKLYYVGCGVDDTLAYAGSKSLVELLKKHGFNYQFRESSGGHTWFNWRIYLGELAPKLFR